jgi:hypothetical protein
VRERFQNAIAARDRVRIAPADRGTGPDEVELAEGLSELWDPALPAEEPERPRSHARPDPT